ncbi:MAG: TetR family transcriptional regulator [Solirubrobacteraceae bacterium]|nr:TetR family transcriptional regulator [Solirubrobacteraceae bacterium]
MASIRTTAQAAARQATRTTLLEAARELLRERRWNDITMSDVSTAVGVSRQTLYNEFGSRKGFVQAYLLYDADRILSAVDHAIETAGPEPAITIEHAFLVFLETIAEDPLAVTVLSGEDPDGLLALVTTRGGPVLQIAAYRLAAAIGAKWPNAMPADVQLLAEQLVRLAISHAALPDDGDTAATAKSIAALLTPFAELALLRASITDAE